MMAKACCGLVSEKEATVRYEPRSRAARRRRMEIRKFKFVSGDEIVLVMQPDRPDELQRIESAGGRVIDWGGPRVLGVLAMSRAIGDNYLKPYVICEPEITITDRAASDDCLILASDGLRDVLSNQSACGVAKMCLNGKGLQKPPWTAAEIAEGVALDKACEDTCMLLTKLALARHSTIMLALLLLI